MCCYFSCLFVFDLAEGGEDAGLLGECLRDRRVQPLCVNHGLFLRFPAVASFGLNVAKATLQVKSEVLVTIEGAGGICLRFHLFCVSSGCGWGVRRERASFWHSVNAIASDRSL
jgi:hypothetical protein